jgi:hypothetical protein
LGENARLPTYTVNEDAVRHAKRLKEGNPAADQLTRYIDGLILQGLGGVRRGFYIGAGRVWPGPKALELGQYITVSSGVGRGEEGIEWYTVNTLRPPQPRPVLVPEPNPEPAPHPSHHFWAKVGAITGGVVAAGVTVWWAGKVVSRACGPARFRSAPSSSELRWMPTS